MAGDFQLIIVSSANKRQKPSYCLECYFVQWNTWFLFDADTFYYFFINQKDWNYISLTWIFHSVVSLTLFFVKLHI